MSYQLPTEKLIHHLSNRYWIPLDDRDFGLNYWGLAGNCVVEKGGGEFMELSLKTHDLSGIE
jgi:hypothetical protein